MKVRLAKEKDFEEISEMFSKIVENMNNQDIKIWNKDYPFIEIQNDIKNKNYYVITLKETIIAGFALVKNAKSQECFEWSCNDNDAIFLARVGVNTNNLRQGVGTKVLEFAKDISKQKGFQYLRLMVSSINTPAINFYYKNNLTKVAGEYIKYFAAQNSNLTGYGFEIKL